MLTINQIERQTRQLLAASGVARPPVPVTEIAQHLGITVRYERSPSEVSGALYRTGASPIIGVNDAHATTRQRFTIAHEVGHFTLHDGDFYIDHQYAAELPRKVAAPGTKRFRRDQTSSAATDPHEIEANRFAAALLMPIPFLALSLQGLTHPLRDDDVRRLAAEYQVSPQAMSFRLANLGVALEL